MVVIGAGPAGLAAAVYGASEGLKPLWLSRKRRAGKRAPVRRLRTIWVFPLNHGSAWDAGHIRRHHGLVQRVFMIQRAVGLRIDGQYRFVKLGNRREVSSHVVLLAPGVQYRKFGIPGAGAGRRGRGYLLWRSAGGSELVQGRRGICGRGSENSAAAGGALLCQICLQSDGSGARQGAWGHDVEILNR